MIGDSQMWIGGPCTKSSYLSRAVKYLQLGIDNC